MGAQCGANGGLHMRFHVAFGCAAVLLAPHDRDLAPVHGVLLVTTFGQSSNLQEAYRLHGIDAISIVDAALTVMGR